MKENTRLSSYIALSCNCFISQRRKQHKVSMVFDDFLIKISLRDATS